MKTHWLFERIEQHGKKLFLAAQGQEYMYRQLLEAVHTLDAEFSEKIPAGASVALLGDYTLSGIASLLWLFGNGNVVVPIAGSAEVDCEDRMQEAFCRYVLDARAGEGVPVFAERQGEVGTHQLLEQLRAKGHAGLVLFSSGTSGKPKAMIHDLDQLVDAYADRKQRNLSLIIFLLFDHIGGINTLLNALATGSFLVAPEQRDAEEVAGLIEKYRVAILPTSPTFLNLLLVSEAHRQHDLSSLRIITYGTEPMPASLLSRLREVFPKVRFLQTFGTSETGILRTDSKSSDSLFIKLDDPNIEYKVVDGELWLRSKTQILGYLNYSMENFTEDGWFRTGDRVEVSEDGYLRILGRTKEMINVGGEKVSPAEVESVILEVPGVVDCTVFGQTSPITGQIVAAKVVIREGCDEATMKTAIRSHCSQKLARYKVPVKITFSDAALFGSRFKKKRSEG